MKLSLKSVFSAIILHFSTAVQSRRTYFAFVSAEFNQKEKMKEKWLSPNICMCRPFGVSGCCVQRACTSTLIPKHMLPCDIWNELVPFLSWRWVLLFMPIHCPTVNWINQFNQSSACASWTAPLATAKNWSSKIDVSWYFRRFQTYLCSKDVLMG